MRAGADLDLVRRLETLGAAAWPAAETTMLDGWALRTGEGYTKRANSAWALDAPRGDRPLAGRIDAFEAHYRVHGLPPVFRVTPLAEPELTAAFDARGWRTVDDTRCMVAPLVDGASLADPAVTAAEHLDAAWLDGWAALSATPPAQHAPAGRLLRRIVPRRGFFRLDEDGALAAVGLGVVEDGWIGLNDIVADPSRRRRGYARRLVASMLAWGRAQGATRAWLQVVASNAPAIPLYESLGFVDAYRYRYRLRPA